MTDAQFHALMQQLRRIGDALEKLAAVQEHSDEVLSRAAAIEAWANGQGKHPDD